MDVSIRLEHTKLHNFLLEKAKKQNHIQANLFSEALILASTNPKYDKRLFIELQVQYMKIASSKHVQNTLRTR